MAIARGETFFADNPEAAQRLADETLKANTSNPDARGDGPACLGGAGILRTTSSTSMSLPARGARSKSWAWRLQRPGRALPWLPTFAFLRHPLAVELTQQQRHRER